MKEPATFKAFWSMWERSPLLKRFRPDFAYVAATFEAIGALNERQRLIAAGWIEPKPVISPPTIKHARASWPFMQLHDHEPQEHTGLSVPETP